MVAIIFTINVSMFIPGHNFPVTRKSQWRKCSKFGLLAVKFSAKCHFFIVKQKKIKIQFSIILTKTR